jgi:hypothetical protein
MLYLVSYDLTGKEETEYEDLIATLRKLEGERVLLSEWLVPTEMKALALCDLLGAYITANDFLLVTEVTKETAWQRTKLADDAVQRLYASARSWQS